MYFQGVVVAQKTIFFRRGATFKEIPGMVADLADCLVSGASVVAASVGSALVPQVLHSRRLAGAGVGWYSNLAAVGRAVAGCGSWKLPDALKCGILSW